MSAANPVNLAPKISPLRGFVLAGQDVMLAITGWRIWTTMAWNDISQRYRRSVIGPFWLTLSTAFFVAALGLIYATLLHQNIKTYLPYLATGFVFWGMISNFLVESAQCFISAEGYLKQMRMSKIGLVLRMVLRNFIIFLHNIVVIIAVMVIFQVVPGPYVFLIIPALVLNLAFGTGIALLLGLACTRFRDINQIVISLVSVLLFCTPIFWNPATAAQGLKMVAAFNPIASLIAIFRDPLLGLPVNPYDWWMAGGSTLGVAIISGLFFVRFRARIPYWL